jgi:hypothetical protein
MSVLSPKTRLVSFRVSEKEYEELRVLCMAQQARSLSDFVRDSMQRYIHPADPPRSAYPAEGPHALFQVQPITYGRRTAAYPQQETAMQSIAALTDMMLALHRRTEALDRQVNRLIAQMQHGRQPLEPAAGEGRDSAAEDKAAGPAPVPSGERR